MSSMINLFNRKKKDFVIDLLKGKSCDNCLHFGYLTTDILDEWCSYSNVSRIPKSRTCKRWEDGYNF